MLLKVLNPDNYSLTLYALPVFLTGGAVVALGIYVLLRERGSSLSISFWLFSACIGLWLLATGLNYASTDESVSAWWIRLLHYGVVWIPTTTVILALSIVQRREQYRFLIRVISCISLLFCLGIAATDLFLKGVYHYPWGYYGKYGILGLIFLLFFGAAVFLNLYLLWVEYRRSTTERQRKRLKGLLWAFSMAYLGSVDFVATFGIPLYPFGYLPVFCFVGIAAWVIVRYRLVDITPELATNQILETMHGAVIVEDLEGKIRVVNRVAEEMLGCSKAELLGNSLESLVSSPPTFLENVRLGKYTTNNEMVWPGSQGHRYTVSVSASPLTDDRDKSLIGVVYVGHDITEQKRAEEEKDRLAQRLRQAQKMEAIGTLAGGIAHDFNNILNIILGYADLAMDSTLPDSSIASDLGQVITAGNRAKELVHQILAFSRQSRVERITIRLQSLIKETLKMLRSSLPTTIDIISDLDSNCGAVLIDPTHAHQILMNLCTNAHHAMETTGGILSIAFKGVRIDSDSRQGALGLVPGEYAELTVSDTGHGIGPDLIDKIFDPYFTTKEVGKGTGMGLSIIHGIIADCGGAITVESEPGKGTSFHVYLPVIEREGVPLDKDAEETPPRGKERVLFIDDEELLAQMGKEMLERLGYHVTVRQSSLEALSTFQGCPEAFDVIVTDQTMPNMTGADLARRMLQIRPDIPIILCTGYSSLVDQDSAAALGVKEFALKPLTRGRIARLIRKVLDDSLGAGH